MQSPNTGMKSGEVCATEGWAFAYNTYRSAKSVVEIIWQVQKVNIVCDLYGTWDNEQPARRDQRVLRGGLSYGNPLHLCGSCGEPYRQNFFIALSVCLPA